ncbi:MAG: hypothetical protein ACI4IR_01685 [Eubacterium sp.]
MKKRFLLSCVMILTVLVMLFSATSCHKKSYGEVLDSQVKLTEEMEADNLSFKYPEYMGSDSDDCEYQYIAAKDADDSQYYGYKIYCFGSPFYTSVASFNAASDELLSDEESRTPFLTEISSKSGNIKVYSGKGHKDALYLIGCINIDQMHYEVRVTSNEEMKDNEYVHAIYEDNEYYDKALEVIKEIVENLS